MLLRRRWGAFLFHKKSLPRLKYTNPGLVIDVKTDPKQPPLLTLHFESTDREALQAIASASEHPRDHLPKQIRITAQDDPAARSGNWRDAPARPGTEIKTEEAPRDTSSDKKRPTAADDEIRLKSQPAADPATPSSVSAPEAVYERSVTLSVHNRPFWDIWSWFKKRTGGHGVQHSPEDLARFAENGRVVAQTVSKKLVPRDSHLVEIFKKNAILDLHIRNIHRGLKHESEVRGGAGAMQQLGYPDLQASNIFRAVLLKDGLLRRSDNFVKKTLALP